MSEKAVQNGNPRTNGPGYLQRLSFLSKAFMLTFGSGFATAYDLAQFEARVRTPSNASEVSGFKSAWIGDWQGSFAPQALFAAALQPEQYACRQHGNAMRNIPRGRLP